VGKTTLGLILGGYIKPSEGMVLLDGKSLAGNGYSPVQCIHQHPEMAVNPRWIVGQIMNEAFTPPDKLIRSLGISNQWFTRYPHELSGGELQRVAVARALGPKTRYLIADEISAMMDSVTQAQLWYAIMEHCRNHGIGLVVISHDEALLNRLCQRIENLCDLLHLINPGKK
jgi:peptide/nickel transport system ATP-binding protein